MLTVRKFFTSPLFDHVLRLSITTIFLFGLLPVPVMAQPDSTPPAAVTNLAASSPTSNSITLTWTASGNDGNTDGTNPTIQLVAYQ